MRFSLQALTGTSKSRWQAELEAKVEAIHSPEPSFNVEVGSVKSYDDMFAGTVMAVWKEVNLIQEALHRGRVLISGRGGGAKTVLLGRLAKRALRMDCVPVLLSLKDWTQAHAEVWKSFDSPLVRMDFLLRSLPTSGIGTTELDSLHPSIHRVIFVDGLNEVDSRTAQQFIFSLDEYTSIAINTSVIVSDRLVRREFIRSDRWSLCLMLPLTGKEIEHQLSKSKMPASAKTLNDEERELLNSPYFLDAYLHSGHLAETRAGEIRKWFKAHVGLTDDDLSRASEAAYAVYGGASRTFELSAFEEIAGPDTTQKLIKSGSHVLLVDGDVAIFDHHLKHDFLASSHLAANERLWTSDSFDHVTFSGSSFDAIMMAIEQITENAADRFIRAVYDWNLYGIGYSLGESRKHQVSAEMRTVILAMFAERKWDLVLPTKQRALDTLRLLKERDALTFLQTKSLEEVFKLIKAHQPSVNAGWFLEWQQLFTLPLYSEVSNAIVNSVKDADSVRGWTSANVLKRANLSEDQQQILRTSLESANSVVRWRAAHALGSFASEANATALLGLLLDPDKKVRYGAVRSLLELASRTVGNLRQHVFSNLIQQTEHLIEFSSVQEEIRRCVLIPGAQDPRSWLTYCLKLMSAVQPASTESERDKWSRAAQEMIDMFAVTEPHHNA